MRKRIKISLIICIVVLLTSGCNNKSKEITIEEISKSISEISSITDICIVTEENDPNGKLNKSGGYTGALYFEDSRVPKVTEVIDDDTFEGRPPKDICEAGTIAGGSIEIYKNVEDAEKRNDYLSTFDGTALSSGHIIYNNIVIRTSDEFTASEQKQLEQLIIEKIK